MTRVLLLVIGAIVVVLVAAAIIKTFFWLALIALVVLFAGLALGLFRLGHRSGKRSRDRF